MNFPSLSVSGACPAHVFHPPQPEEENHAKLTKRDFDGIRPYALEQGQIDRSEAAVAAQTRLGYPHQAADRGTHPRLGHVQSRHR